LWFRNRGSVDVLLSDIVMPGQSGVDLAAELAADSRPPRTILMSGCLPDELEGLPREVTFLSKPFSVTGLTDTVQATLDAPAIAGGSGDGGPRDVSQKTVGRTSGHRG